MAQMRGEVRTTRTHWVDATMRRAAAAFPGRDAEERTRNYPQKCLLVDGPATVGIKLRQRRCGALDGRGGEPQCSECAANTGTQHLAAATGGQSREERACALLQGTHGGVAATSSKKRYEEERDGSDASAGTAGWARRTDT